MKMTLAVTIDNIPEPPDVLGDMGVMLHRLIQLGIEDAELSVRDGEIDEEHEANFVANLDISVGGSAPTDELLAAAKRLDQYQVTCGGVGSPYPFEDNAKPDFNDDLCLVTDFFLKPNKET